MSQRRIKRRKIQFRDKRTNTGNSTQINQTKAEETQMDAENLYIYYRTLSDMYTKHAELLKAKEGIFCTPVNQNQIDSYEKAAECLNLAINAYKVQFDLSFPDLISGRKLVETDLEKVGRTP